MHATSMERHDRKPGPLPVATEEEKAANAAGVAQFIDAHGGAGAMRTGRAWRTSELRLKSFEDLQKLWFILLKERNVLLTEKEWCRSNQRYWVNGESNLYKVKRSMARIKGVVGERSRAYKARLALKDAKSIGREKDAHYGAEERPRVQGAP